MLYGSSKRGYVYVKDLVETTVKIIHEKQNHWERETFNVGGSEVVELKMIVDVFKDMIPGILIQELDMPKTDIYKNYAETTKAQKKLGFKPKPMFEKNLRKIIKNELWRKKLVITER